MHEIRCRRLIIAVEAAMPVEDSRLLFLFVEAAVSCFAGILPVPSRGPCNCDMQSFDMNGGHYRSETAGAKKCPRCKVIAVLCCIAILTIGVIIASGFAIAGAFKSYPQDSGECPAKPVVWQDVACCRKTCKKNWDPLPFLLISLDGFRYDYLQRNKTPSLKRLIECGVHAPFMFPSYPTKTFPNHYAIITGLYPESHGIIDNTMYDETVTPEKDRHFSMGSNSSTNSKWWWGEPFWNTVMKNGKRAATYFWPGSDGIVQDMRPNYFLPYNMAAPFYGRVDQILEWMTLPEKDRPDFFTMYFDQPDTDGHAFGPDSPQVTDKLLTVDAQINYLLTRLLQEDLLHCFNIVILADHGMQKVQQILTLDRYIPTQDLAIFGGPIARIAMNKSSATPEQIRDELACKNKSYRVYLRQDMPRRTHFSNNYRIGDVVLDGNAGVDIYGREPGYEKHGDHGYDNRLDAMHALFLAWGPSYKQNYTIRPFQNIELYNFFADTLRLEKRAPNNGTLGVLDEIFIKPPERKGAQLQSKVVSACASKAKACGTCAEKSLASCNSTVDASTLLQVFTDQRQCYGSICDAGTSVVYNSDFQLSSAVFQTSATKPALTTTSSPCAKLTYAEIECQKISSIETALERAKMTMFPLSIVGNASSAKIGSGLEAWELKAPMHNGFSSGIWQYLDSLTQEYTQRFGNMIVVSGPIFDYDSNGLADEISIARNGSSRKYSFSDVLVPSHYYRILIRCSGQWAFPRCQGEPEPLSFVLPNVPEIDNCMEPRSYLAMNMARIRDIELLTGLEFFQKGLLGDCHKSILLRTKITEDIW